jgi:hypothetical protein
MSLEGPQVGDVIIKKDGGITLVQRRKANGQDETARHERLVELAVAKASPWAAKDELPCGERMMDSTSNCSTMIEQTHESCESWPSQAARFSRNVSVIDRRVGLRRQAFVR